MTRCGGFLPTVVAIVGSLALASAEAHAQAPAPAPAGAAVSEADAVAAEALFSAGRTDVDKGDYAAACPKFAESQRLDPAPGTLINLADCEEHIGHLARAWLLWREALDRLPTDDARRQGVAARVTTIDRRVPRLTLDLAPGARSAADVRIRRDDVDVPTRHLGVAVPVDPGEHTIYLHARGFAASRYVVTLAEGARQNLALDVGPPDPSNERPAAPAPSPAPPAPRRDESPRPSPFVRTLGWGLVGTGVVGFGVGGATGLAAIGKKSDQEQNCFPIDVCKPEGSSAADDGRTLATVSTVSFVVGAVALAAGIYLVLTSRSP